MHVQFIGVTPWACKKSILGYQVSDTRAVGPCILAIDNGALYGFSLWVAYYNFLRPHPYNYWRPLNELTELKNADNMPAKWQILISLRQQTMLNMQENKYS